MPSAEPLKRGTSSSRCTCSVSVFTRSVFLLPAGTPGAMADNYDGLHVNGIPQYQEYDPSSAPQVWPADPLGLDVKHRNDTFPYFKHRHAIAVEIEGSPVPAARAGDVPKSSKQNRRLKWTGFGALLAVIVVMAVVVGSVLGVRRSSKSS